MDLCDALGDFPSSQGGQPNQRNWPGQPCWPGQPSQPSQPCWPGQPSQPSQPSQPCWPGQPSQPSQPCWPGHGEKGSGTWPSHDDHPPQPTQPGEKGSGTWPSHDDHTPQPTQPLTVPYSLELVHGVYDKLLITINGTIKPNADKITVDLCSCHGPAFHFNPRFNEGGSKVIVRNSCCDNVWGSEERELDRFPFVQGQPFEIKILCSTKEFKVAVNNEHLLAFQHRVTDLRSICHLNIYYDLTLTGVKTETAL